MNLPLCSTQTPVISYTRTELPSLRSKASFLGFSTFDRFKDLNIGILLPPRHRSCQGDNCRCKRCEISTFIKDNGVDISFVTETWLSAQVGEAKTVELAPMGFDVK